MNTTAERRPLDAYLDAPYRFTVVADPDGGYVVEYPDLPGCLTQVESAEEIVSMAEEARRLWLRTAYEQGLPIPILSYPESYSGRFNVRLPRSLHRRLAEQADADGVSLNQLVVALLSATLMERQAAERMDALLAEIRSLRRAIGRGAAAECDRAARYTTARGRPTVTMDV
jgi:predicted RNase H-like HicB family nuclease